MHVAAAAAAAAEQQVQDARDSSDSKRKFRVLGLKFPGEWTNNEKFLELLERSESFHMWFEKNLRGGVKQGGLSVMYETAEEAKQAFASVQKMTFDGMTLKLQASKLFYDPLPSARHVQQQQQQQTMPFEPNFADSARRLYALHLTLATDQTLLSSIFGSECIEAVQIRADPFIHSEKQAEIVFRTAEEANYALIELADGFEIDEGDRQLTMRLLTTDEYVSHMRSEQERVSGRLPAVTSSAPGSVSSSTSPSAAASAPSDSSVAQFVPAAEITEEDVTGFLQQHVDTSRTNWAELNDANELWKLCDEVSELHKGIPDSLLHVAMLNVLDRYRRTLTTHWMRQHVDELVRMWKKELRNRKCALRPTSYTVCAAPYTPYKVRRKKAPATAERKRALATVMAVGEILPKVRTLLATEEGELEIDEDEHGNYSIQGEPLSFNTWAVIHQPAQATSEEQSVTGGNLAKLRNKLRKESWQQKAGEEKRRKVEETSNEGETEKDDSAILETSGGTEAESLDTSRELEEGEMFSDTSSSSASSSSFEDEDDDQSAYSGRRRGHRERGKCLLVSSHALNCRKAQLNSVQAVLGSVSPQFTALFTQLYEQRHKLCQKLSTSHKHAFVVVLGQILSSPRGMTTAQKNQMNLFIQNFAAQNLPK
ncbi:unnamed protein product [Gongylonema pulchrum]|uniref:RRM domain-containing protein n=1 Tax=Gongylonema pulchrum TaxID=637853 RepID=A0A183DQ74_9BILA|nr:unnamed protein product [Gongylonema pulchrum]